MAKRLAWRRQLACAAVITAFGVGAYQIRELKAQSPVAKKTSDEQSAVGKEPAPPAEEGKNPKKEELPRKTKVFRLSHLDPEEALVMLEGLLDMPPLATTLLTPSGVDAQNAQVVPPLGALGGGLGALGSGVGALGALSGALGAIGGVGGNFGAMGVGAGTGGFGTAATWRLVIDGRTRSLVVRATEPDLQVAADLVAVLDRPADKPVPKVKTLHAFKLRFASGGELAGVLHRLEFKARLVAFPGEQEDPRSTMIVVRASEDVIKEIGTVIEQLDVEVKDPPENNPKEETKSEGKGGPQRPRN
jgi:hypothetical protein